MGVSEWTAQDIPDLTGKVAIVTGANVGLGLEITRKLAEKKCEVIMACRNMEKATAAWETLLEELGPKIKVEVMKLDVSSMDSVKEFAAEFKRRHQKLDFLMENAGVMALFPRQESVDGNELQLATNHLGHFVLTGELMPLLTSTEGSRVVTQSSCMHWLGSFNWNDLQGKRYIRYLQYAMTKLANVAFATELQNRLTQANLSNPTVYSVHPGVVNGQLQENAVSALWEAVSFKLLSLCSNNVHQGAIPALFALTSPEAKAGQFYGPDGICRGLFRGDHPRQRSVNKLVDKPGVIERFWKESEILTNYKFDVQGEQSGVDTTNPM